MSDYPDPDEEYELMYADEFELLRETEESSAPAKKKPIQAKRSLDFSVPVISNNVGKQQAPPTLVSQVENPPVSEDIVTLTPSLEPVEDLFTPNISNKRTVDDLFGDIDDIDFEEVNLPSKRQKTDEEIDFELIDKIVEGRKLKQMLMEPSGRTHGQRQNIYDAKENLSLDIPRWAFMPLTNSDGERIYIKLVSEDSWAQSLDCPTEQLSLRANYASAWEEARMILQKKQEEKERLESQLTQPLQELGSEVGTKLWVEKYRPHSYVDLLSEEPVNRALLHWLHLWDKIVFKKEVKMKEPQQRTAFSKRAGQFQLQNKWKGKKDAEPELDEDGRPHHKVALLCGPPGVGKTTLAHLLARLAGYRPLELNASDERSTDAFRSALQSATQMRSVIDAEKRPNCLILDEIDGAPLPTVELLVRWCTTSVASEAGGKKKGKAQPLKRPVVAICNDLYAPALRPLRSIALVIHVGGVTLRRLSSRLSRVCECEGLSVPVHVVSALARRAQGDIRAAIQVLSMVKARAREQLSMDDVLSERIGVKDCNKSVIQALQAVFTATNEPDTYKRVLSVVSAAGEYERLIEGIFSLYVVGRVDARLLIACDTMRWLRTYDVVHAWTVKRQNYSLYGLLPICVAACHLALASRTPPKIWYPSEAQEINRKKTEVENIVTAVRMGASPSVAPSMRRALQLDVLPLLPYLLTPSLRSANVQLCSESERKCLRVAASAMCDYGLEYVQQRTQEGLYAFVLEPDIYRVAFFGTEERGRPPPMVRQAIAREQQLENIRRTEAQAGKITCSQEVRKQRKIDSKTMNNDSRLPNHLQRLRPKEVERTTPLVHRDFFGRVVPLVESSQRSDGARDVISSSSVFYQYQEGFNNAVRRSVRMRDLL